MPRLRKVTGMLAAVALLVGGSLPVQVLACPAMAAGKAACCCKPGASRARLGPMPCG